jgi:hypothetical protein
VCKSNHFLSIGKEYGENLWFFTSLLLPLQILAAVLNILKRKQILHSSLFTFLRTFAAAKKHGQSCTASSLGIPQDGNIARVLGCSSRDDTPGTLQRLLGPIP